MADLTASIQNRGNGAREMAGKGQERGEGKGRTGFAQWQWGEEEENETLIQFYRVKKCCDVSASNILKKRIITIKGGLSLDFRD